MDPLTLGISAVGFGLKLFGGFGASEDASKAAQLSAKISGVETQQNDIRRQSMEMSARRQTLQDVRNMQRMRAQAIQAGTNQGAQYGSGLAGGLAEVTNEGLFQTQGINQNLQSGRQMFTLDNQISQYRSQIAQYQSDQATNQGLASLGGSLVSAAGTIGAFGKGLGSFFGGFGGGNYSGTPGAFNTGGLY